MLKNSRYGLLHALLGVVLTIGALICLPACMAGKQLGKTGLEAVSTGFQFVWHQFVYGVNAAIPADKMLDILGQTVLVFFILLLILWAVGYCFPTRRSETGDTEDVSRVPDWSQAAKTVLIAFPVLTLVALGLNLLCTHGINWCTGVKPAEQPLVKCFADGTYGLGLKSMLIAVVLFEAPLFEEPIFRGVILRGFARRMPFWAAAALSGFVFAMVHVNAASFIPLCFLGIAFAWLYRRTGTLLAPMTAHFLFNLTNVVLLFCFPEIAT